MTGPQSVKYAMGSGFPFRIPLSNDLVAYRADEGGDDPLDPTTPTGDTACSTQPTSAPVRT